MIAQLRGRLISKHPTEAVVDVQGLAYGLQIPLSTFSSLGETGTEVTLLTHLQVREDALILFGFLTESERSLFRLLLSVNGIGPRLAQNILSGVSTGELQALIRTGNTSALTSIPGIGRKTAERIVVELREKVIKSGVEDPLDVRSQTPVEIRAEALQAMIALGYPRSTAEKALRAVLQNENEPGLTVEELVKRGLKQN